MELLLELAGVAPYVRDLLVELLDFRDLVLLAPVFVSD